MRRPWSLPYSGSIGLYSVHVYGLADETFVMRKRKCCQSLTDGVNQIHRNGTDSAGFVRIAVI